MARGNITDAEDYHLLAAEEATLAKAAVTNAGRARHYAMAAHYTRLAETTHKVAIMTEFVIRDANPTRGPVLFTDSEARSAREE